jgi:magnesium-transporting ATPase (P-type)
MANFFTDRLRRIFNRNKLHSAHESNRTIYVNVQLDSNHHKKPKYGSNRISTSKYNILTFLFIFLYEQFRKFSNIFFLAVSLIQQVPDVSPTGKFTTLVPLIFILSVSAVKEIIEDLVMFCFFVKKYIFLFNKSKTFNYYKKRSRSDHLINNKKTLGK